MRRQLLAALFTFAVSVTVSNQHADASLGGDIRQHVAAQSAAIAGRVLDPDGQPVPRAGVWAERTDFTTGKRLPYTYTDEQGRFLIKSLAPGKYWIYAAKEDDGYPPTDSDFHSVGPVDAPQVAVYEQQTTSGVVVKLGPKVARLVGRIADSATSKPINNAEITLRRVDRPDYFYLTGPNIRGEFDILAPSVPFTIKITARGYQEWHYRKKNSREQSDALQLASGSTKEMLISLQPAK